MLAKTSTAKSNTKLLPIREASRILKVHKETLRRWDNSGKLKATRVGIRQDRQYKPEDIIRLLQKR